MTIPAERRTRNSTGQHEIEKCFRRITMKKLILLTIVILAATAAALGQYKQPPKEIMDVLNAPPIPNVTISPARDKMLLAEPLRYPSISELAEPMLRIAGMRINPNNNGRHRQPYSVRLTIKNISDGKEMPIAFPAGAKLFSTEFSPDGKHIAVGNMTAHELQLRIVDTANA